MATITEEGLKKQGVSNEDFEKDLEAQDSEANKMNDLKEKLKRKQEADAMSKDDMSVSIKLGVVGVGQAGSRIAQEFGKLGYHSYAINTSKQDLEFIDIPTHKKLLLEGSLGGTGKDLDLGRDIFEANYSILEKFVEDVVSGNDMLYLALSGVEVRDLRLLTLWLI